MTTELSTDAIQECILYADLPLSACSQDEAHEQLQALLDENEKLKQSLKNEARWRRDDVVRWQEKTTKYRNLYLELIRIYGDEAVNDTTEN